MTLKTYLLGMAASVILCFVSLALIIIYIDPTKAGITGIALFYASLFFFLTSLFTLAEFYLKRKSSREAEFVKAETAFRQGVLLSFVFIGVLILQNLRMLNFGNALLLILAVSLLELYFSSRE